MKHINKTSGSTRLATLLAGVALLGLTSQSALALTASNTTISNLATLSYSVSGVAQPVLESSSLGNTTPGAGNGAATTFVVDKKINLTVVEVDVTFHATVPGQLATSGNNAMHYTVTNLGNDPQDFSLATSQMANGQTLFGGTDNYDSTGCSAFIDANANGIFDGGEATYIDELASLASQVVTVTCDTPVLQVNGDVSLVAMTATALAGGGVGVQGAALVDAGGAANTAGVDIVFADANGTDDIAHDAKHSDRDAYRVGTATLTVTKTATLLCDPVNGTVNPHHIPGATVRYVVRIANAAGSAAATLTSISDVIDTVTLAHDANLVTTASSCVTPESAAGSGFKVTVLGSTRAGPYPKYFTSAADADAVGIAAGTITAAIATALPAESGYLAGELRASETLELTFNVIIQ